MSRNLWQIRQLAKSVMGIDRSLMGHAAGWNPNHHLLLDGSEHMMLRNGAKMNLYLVVIILGLAQLVFPHFICLWPTPAYLPTHIDMLYQDFCLSNLLKIETLFTSDFIHFPLTTWTSWNCLKWHEMTYPPLHFRTQSIPKWKSWTFGETWLLVVGGKPSYKTVVNALLLQVSPHRSQPARPVEQLGKSSKIMATPGPITAQVSQWAVDQAQQVTCRFCNYWSRTHIAASNALAAGIVSQLAM